MGSPRSRIRAVSSITAGDHAKKSGELGRRGLAPASGTPADFFVACWVFVTVGSSSSTRWVPAAVTDWGLPPFLPDHRAQVLPERALSCSTSLRRTRPGRLARCRAGGSEHGEYRSRRAVRIQSVVRDLLRSSPRKSNRRCRPAVRRPAGSSRQLRGAAYRPSQECSGRCTSPAPRTLSLPPPASARNRAGPGIVSRPHGCPTTRRDPGVVHDVRRPFVPSSRQSSCFSRSDRSRSTSYRQRRRLRRSGCPQIVPGEFHGRRPARVDQPLRDGLSLVRFVSSPLRTDSSRMTDVGGEQCVAGRCRPP